MIDRETELFRQLSELEIAVTTLEHEAVFTVEQAQEHTGHLPGGHCKNLFLKDKKGGFWLIVCLDEQVIRVGEVQKMIEAPRLSFAKPEALDDVLGVQPGSVTPFALINDHDRVVQPVLDEKMLRHDQLNFHPLRNTATTTIASADLLTFIEHLGYRPIIRDLDPA